MRRIAFVEAALWAVVLLAPCILSAEEAKSNGLRIGWAAVEITPNQPVNLRGYFRARVSEGVLNPLTATALALESVRGGAVENCAVMVSIDLISVGNAIRDSVRERVRKELPALESTKVFLNATHTHLAPSFGPRSPDKVAFGLGHAVVGRNRLIAYFDGRSSMYGKTDRPEFSHVEGYEDHAVNLLYTWDAAGKLTGVMVNLACPSQAAGGYQISADFWHDARLELRKRLGEGLFVLPQCSAARDQSSSVLVGQKAEARMDRLTGRSRRAEGGPAVAREV